MKIKSKNKLSKIPASYQEKGKDAVSLEPGMVITISANVKHWHELKKILGLAILQLKYQEKIQQMSGVSQ